MIVDSVKSLPTTYQGSVPVAVTKKPENHVNSEPIIKEIITVEDNIDETQITKQDTEAIKKIIAQMNKLSNSTAEFEYHEGTHRTVIKIVDKQTKEVIKEFPTEKMLDALAKTWEMLGIMVDERR